jgi:PTS system cellobiose-specific IIC component
MSDFMNDKIIPVVMGFVNTAPMQALKDGLLYSMPMMIVGSIFLLLQQFPWTPVQTFLQNIGLYDIFGVTYANTFNIMSLIAAIGIANTYVKQAGYEGLPAGVISLSCWLMSEPQFIMHDETAVSGVIVRDWLAGKGMMAALLIGLVVGAIYTWFMKKNITIKMPAGVPQGVATAFTALIPAAVIITAMTLLVYIVEMCAHTTILEWIYATLQTPLQGITDSVGGVFIYTFMIGFLWWFGIHGGSVMGGVLGSVLISNYSDNQAILDAGKELTLENGAHVFTAQVMDMYGGMTGCGITLGLVIYMLFFAKSEQLKSIGKLGIAPGIFNINEPVTFGTPIVLNPMLAIPFIFIPVIVQLASYYLIKSGILPFFTGIIAPWTCPPIIGGLITAGWRGAVWQAVILLFSFVAYFPFARAYDKQLYAEEQEAACAM